MTGKPCAYSLPQLKIDETNCGCIHRRGNLNRTARNAILPFYYDCTLIDSDGECKKIFFIKNPKFFSGSQANNPGSQVTKAMRFSHLSRNFRNVDGRRTVIMKEPGQICNQPSNNIDWYGGIQYNLNEDNISNCTYIGNLGSTLSN